MRFRLAALALAAAVLSGVTLAPLAAAAAPNASPSPALAPISIPCTVGGVSQTCTFTITSFQIINGVLNAVGTLTIPTLGSFQQAIPVSLSQSSASCQILHLTLGPLHLNLLGVTVDLSQVTLDITAHQGPGNLLGNLLCAVANLLNAPLSGSALNHVANLLNQILRLL